MSATAAVLGLAALGCGSLAAGVPTASCRLARGGPAAEACAGALHAVCSRSCWTSSLLHVYGVHRMYKHG